ncbi:MAG: hypothetical protein R3Y15_01365 [Rikenellaceae bacterium]
MKSSENVNINDVYESPTVKLVEFEVEAGFAASSISEINDIDGIEGTLWTASPGNTY